MCFYQLTYLPKIGPEAPAFRCEIESLPSPNSIALPSFVMKRPKYLPEPSPFVFVPMLVLTIGLCVVAVVVLLEHFFPYL